jgi:hypothetical protein
MRTRPRLQLLQGEPISPSTFVRVLTAQVYAILDEIFLAGEVEETSKDVVLQRLEELERLE